MSRITLRKIKLAFVKATISTLGLSGIIALILGSTSCFIGLSGTATIKLGELLSPHRLTLKTLMFYGGAGVGSGMFLIGFGAALAQTMGERLVVEELTNYDIVVLSKPAKPAACSGCKNYHGHSYNGVPFVCGIHPYGCELEKCPDWEKE